MEEIYKHLIQQYRHFVSLKHTHFGDWPIVAGCNMVSARYGSALIVHLKHSGTTGMHTISPVSILGRDQVGVETITAGNRASVVARMEVHFRPEPKDMILVFENVYEAEGDRFIVPYAAIDVQLQEALVRHEMVMAMVPMKIFLSHKGIDKPRVRSYHATLKLLGFDPWLDEDAMDAGVSLHRGILKGMKESCAVVFFVTPDYVDDSYIATEIDHAIEEKRQKKDGFAIVTLVFEHEGKKGKVPDLVRPYVWKEPADDLEGLRVILRALPLKVGPVRFGG